MADFFKAAGSGWGEAPGTRGEITNPTDAYAALDVEYGSSLLAVTRAFRDRAKKLHPDARRGDQARNRNPPDYRSVPVSERAFKLEQYGTADQSRVRALIHHRSNRIRDTPLTYITDRQTCVTFVRAPARARSHRARYGICRRRQFCGAARTDPSRGGRSVSGHRFSCRRVIG